eukprot:5661662-Pleurochrysis_carterae.AAC.5
MPLLPDKALLAVAPARPSPRGRGTMAAALRGCCYGGLTPPQCYALLTKYIFRQYNDIRRVRLLHRNRPRRDPHGQ